MAWQNHLFNATIPQHTNTVEDLTPHVDGGANSAGAAAAPASTVTYWAAAYVVGALVALWLLGAVVFRSARL